MSSCYRINDAPGHISHNISCRLALSCQLEKSVDNAKIALAGTLHALLQDPLIQGLTLIAQWVEFGCNDVRGRQTVEVFTPDWAGFGMPQVGLRQIHLVARKQRVTRDNVILPI